MTTINTTKIAETQNFIRQLNLLFGASCVLLVYDSSGLVFRLLHPLSPRGKLVHLGLEGLKATNVLLDASKEYQNGCVLQDELYRVAVNQDHLDTLMETADLIPELAEWLPRHQLPWTAPNEVLGALRLHSGCKVVHVPSYLKGLYHVIHGMGGGDKEWKILDESSSSDPRSSWVKRLEGFDTVVFAAGSGLFQDSIIDEKMPVQLVRGQSIEMTLNEVNLHSAMVCGKYVSPLVEENRILIGATHEFKDQAMDPEQVRLELRERSDAFASNLWEDGTVDRITSGFRVQSNRGKDGRMPIVGKLDSTLHPNAWIFTGLSSRGLLHHGIFGEILASQIIGLQTEECHEGLDWWRGNSRKI
jgi:glycine/D-amino acid oxidase-like deaminating enzyme